LPLAPEPSGYLKHRFIRSGLRFFIRCYLRVRLTGLEHIPHGAGYVLCFSHPNWVDPFLFVAFWPDRPRLFIFGPREEDMTAGWRNRLITWTGLSVPFKPSRSDLLDTTRRAVGVLDAGYVLSIAAEGRLSDREGEIVPLYEGAAYFALRGGVPLLPVAVLGTRWLRFGKTVTVRAGPALSTSGLRANRAGVAAMTVRIRDAIEALLVGAVEEPPPGPFGRWLTDVFNERPWLEEENWDVGRRSSGET
jgi:1-acyl-sn-glycerol-3-phosphate acyltransferase